MAGSASPRSPTLVDLDADRRLPARLPHRPAAGVTQIAYIVFLGHILMATVIDIDHWRHVFLLFGILWGAIAADRSATQARLATGPHRQRDATPSAKPARH